MVPRSSSFTKVTRRATRAIVAALGGPWKRAAFPLQFACVVFPAVLFTGLAWIDYQVEFDRAREEVATTTTALAEHAQTVVETVDLILARVFDHIGDRDWQTIATSPEVHDFLAQLREELPQVEAVFLVAPDGIVAASSRHFPMPPFDLSKMEYFTAARTQTDGRAVITPPIPKTYSMTTGFVISRPRLRNGTFDGVVGVTVSRDYFESFYRVVLNHPMASAAGLIRTDGTLLIRYPLPPSDRPTILPPSNPMLVAAREGKDLAVFTGRSDLDGSARIGGFRRLNDLPLLVGYSVNRSVFLTTWGLHAAVIAVCAILLSFLLLATESLVRRKTAVEHESLRRLVEETERRRQAEAMAQQSQKMEALGRLTGGVAHDFNNLLAVILASLELALRRDRDPRSVRLLQTATEAAQRGAKLTAQMLSFSRKHEVTVCSIDVNAVIRGMDNLLRRSLGPQIRLHYNLADDLWPVLADQVQLELALLNLAVNARDAMPAGGALTFQSRTVVRTALDPTSTDLQPGEYVCIQVVDAGVGMSPEVRARAHEPFFTTKAPGSGTGLGLSMVYGFVRELGGALTFDSAVGVGTTVSLYLRRADRAPLAMTDKAADEAGSARAGRVLVVDDDAGVRTSIREILEEAGHSVVEASGGTEALALLAGDRRFDLVIVDFAMPVMNGGQLAAEITRLWPAAPILFVTGYVENDALRPWVDRGYATMQKPFSARELTEAAERAMRQWAGTAA
jgi:two-component system NtrC family sensor kinase